jgi:pyruvate formate lyase activating enzyme
MKIGGLEKISLIDFPGKITATVFFCGCNFKCPFCQNPELVEPEEITKQPKITEKDFFSFLDARQGLLEGICLTGGEPTINLKLPDFIKKIKQKGFLVKLDTNGSNPEMLKTLFRENLLDFVAMDIKSSLEKYPEAVGIKVNLENIQKSIELIQQSGIEYEFRATVVPGIIDEGEIKKIGQWLKGAKSFALQQFRPEKTLDKAWQKIQPYSEERLKKLIKIIEPYVEKAVLRGV